ncbi:hypothetical protein CC78DRAFT_535188 [Lojkania enalia]|uniref:F-box domain-containing protein n=1 Tax=Lojkania enalia TaxID=147567 RepID=A0A9P4N4I2_9PLEO|nr:hypothetical protein CC78DRAFT_535188 [Didymosphaeria enalia]
MEGQSALLHLPKELRLSILSYCDVWAILNLCLASKAVYNVYLSILRVPQVVDTKRLLGSSFVPHGQS